MAVGKLSISRGHPSGERSGHGPRLALVPDETQAVVPACPEYRLVHDRLAAFERLAKLRDLEILDEAEFLAEKQWILAQRDELVLNEPLIAPEPPRGPSLLARLFSWKVVPLGVAAGVGLSFASQPRETTRFFEEVIRLVGA